MPFPEWHPSFSSFLSFPGVWGAKPLFSVGRMQIRHFRRFRQNTPFLAGDKNTVYQKHGLCDPDTKLARINLLMPNHFSNLLKLPIKIFSRTGQNGKSMETLLLSQFPSYLMCWNFFDGGWAAPSLLPEGAKETLLGWPRSTVEKGPPEQQSELWEGKPSKPYLFKGISTVLWVHQKNPQSTVSQAFPSNKSYESKAGCNRTPATVLWVPLTYTTTCAKNKVSQTCLGANVPWGRVPSKLFKKYVWAF